MTAEVAILNKTAAALAADSAVTISAGSDRQKIYDSADKLFELSCLDPIGVMVNGDMNFAQIPVAVLVKKYREDCGRFKHVPEAAEDFIKYLAKYGAAAPDSVKKTYISRAVRPPLEKVKARSNEAFVARIFSLKNDGAGDFQKRIEDLRLSILDEQFSVMKSALEKLSDATFSGKGRFKPTEQNIAVINESIDGIFEDISPEQKTKAMEISLLVLKKRGTGPSNTGVIVAGFGSDDLFPTLAPYEVYGVVGDRLKYSLNEIVDIDRDGTRAEVIPFAQKEMVERFLYGLDEGIRRNITTFCKTAIPSIREKILEKLEMADDDAENLKREAEEAERAFVDGLANQSFDAIRSQSQAEIEDMVEFMPKPEMARMAEALVNLTSIKRRVSRGLETVGGPIDVAVISRAEGFVWVQRKHYFPPELNSRYFARNRVETDRGGTSDG